MRQAAGRRGPSRLRSSACGRGGSGRPPGQPRGGRERSGRMEDGFSSYSSLYDTSSLLQFCNGKGGGRLPPSSPARSRGPGAPAGRRRRPARGRRRRERACLRLPAASPPPRAARLRSVTRGEEKEEGGNFASLSLPRYTSGNLPASASNFCTSCTGRHIDTRAAVYGCIADRCVHLPGRQSGWPERSPTAAPLRRASASVRIDGCTTEPLAHGCDPEAPRGGGGGRPGSAVRQVSFRPPARAPRRSLPGQPTQRLSSAATDSFQVTDACVE